MEPVLNAIMLIFVVATSAAGQTTRSAIMQFPMREVSAVKESQSPATQPTLEWQRELADGSEVLVYKDVIVSQPLETTKGHNDRLSSQVRRLPQATVRYTFRVRHSKGREERDVWIRHAGLALAGMDPSIKMLDAQRFGLDLVVIFNQYNRCWAYVVHPAVNEPLVIAPRLSPPAIEQGHELSLCEAVGRATVSGSTGKLRITVSKIDNELASFELQVNDGSVRWYEVSYEIPHKR